MTLEKNLKELSVEASHSDLNVGDGIHKLTADGSTYAMPLLLLSLVNAIPVPSFGLKSLLGVIVSLLGIQMLLLKRSAWLPRWFKKLPLSSKVSGRIAKIGERLLPKLEKFVKPRYHWMKYSFASSLLGLVIFLLGLVMILPVPGSKVLTSPVLLAISFGLIKKDGLLVLLASVAALLVVSTYIEVFYLVYNWLLV